MKWQMIFDKVSSEGDIREKVENKLSVIDKYLKQVGSDLKKGVVRLSKGDRWGYKVKVDVKLPKKKVVVEGQGEELLSAIDQAYSRMARVVRKYYEKKRERKDLR